MEKTNVIGKKEFVKIVATRIGTTSNETAKYLDAVSEAIEGLVSEGYKVQIKGFGTFTAVKVAERQGRNPQTGDEITIPAHKKVLFTPSKTFKAKINVL